MVRAVVPGGILDDALAGPRLALSLHATPLDAGWLTLAAAIHAHGSARAR